MVLPLVVGMNYHMTIPIAKSTIGAIQNAVSYRAQRKYVDRHAEHEGAHIGNDHSEANGVQNAVSLCARRNR
jgi:hypothetical protein